MPNLLDIPKGCPFNPRCEYCFEKCIKKLPELIEIEKNHFVRCWLFGEKN